MKQPNSATPPNAWSNAEKLALATGSLSALSLLSFGADASIIYNNTNPVAINFNHASGIGSAVTWSVDGTNVTFKLWKNSGGGSFFLNLASRDSLLGRGLVRQDAQGSRASMFVNLGLGFGVGPSLAAGYNIGGRTSNRTMLSDKAGILKIPDIAKNFASGVNGFFGFRFTDAGLANQFYGWAELNLNTASPGTVTINRWAYNNVAGGSIKVGDTGQSSAVPEPDTLSLTLLGLGAGGLRAWRKRKQALAAAA